jgi:hypothetical protein
VGGIFGSYFSVIENLGKISLQEDKIMNMGRFLRTTLGVWLVRVVLNATFYTWIVGRQFDEIASAHSGMFRTVIPAYIVTDLIFAVVFAFLFVKVGNALGGGVKAGVTLGIIIAFLSPVIATLYEYYQVTYLTVRLAVTVSIFQVIAHAIEGAVAGLIYKN